MKFKDFLKLREDRSAEIEENDAKKFFGFLPHEEIDPILLKSRYLNKLKSFPREEVEANYKVLIPGINFSSKEADYISPGAKGYNSWSDAKNKKKEKDHQDWMRKYGDPVVAAVQQQATTQYFDDSDLTPQESAKRSQLTKLIDYLRSYVHEHQTADIVGSTVSLMSHMRSSIVAIDQFLTGDLSFVSKEQKEEINKLLEGLNTTAITGGILWGEYEGILRPLIDAKNSIFKKLGLRQPYGHDHIERPPGGAGYIH